MDKKTKSVQEWDKTFPKSEKVKHEKVTFKTQYGLTLAADLYIPKYAEGKLPAIAVSGPFGAVKEQCSGLYAQTMAERGFITIAFDPSFTGESSGEPRRTASPDINTEDFLAAVDYLSMRDDVDAGRIGIIGICGWGGIALNAAAQDPHIKATAAITMYDMSRVSGNGSTTPPAIVNVPFLRSAVRASSHAFRAAYRFSSLSSASKYPFPLTLLISYMVIAAVALM